MAANERDGTSEWMLPVSGGPPTLYELEQRVEVALTIARAAEAAALEIGAASIEAAQQARRAAELAEMASLAAAGRAPVAVPDSNGHAPAPPVALDPEPPAPEKMFAPAPEPEPPAPEEMFAPAPEPAPPAPEQAFGPEPEAETEPEPVPDAEPVPEPELAVDPFQERLLAFRERAERVSVRLRRLDGATPISSA